MSLKRFTPVIILILILAACAPQGSTPPPVPIPPGIHIVYPTLTSTSVETQDIASPPSTTTPVETQNLASLPAPTRTLMPLPTCTACMRKPTATVTPQENTGIVLAEKLDVWDDPANENSYWHRQTQLVTGEEVLILGQQGDWDQVIAVEQPSSKDGRGYPGWARASGLAAGQSQSSDSVIVMARYTLALASPQAGAKQLMRLYFDTRLPLVSQSGGWVEAALPDGRKAWLSQKDVQTLQAGKTGLAFNRDALLATARTQAVAPYLWGGTTSDSPDCSGFVYRLFHAYGVTLARDANDQALQGQAVSFDQRQPGDLIFYEDVSGGPVTHVGLFMGGSQIMDANPFLGLSIHPLSDMQKWYVFYGVRRVA